MTNFDDYDLCLIRRSEQDSDVYAAAVLGCHSAIEIGRMRFAADAFDAFTGHPVKVEYLDEQGVTLHSETDAAVVAVTGAIQGSPTQSFRVFTSSQSALSVPTVISQQQEWYQKICIVRFETNLLENADVQALIRHAESFELAMGGLPSGVPLPKCSVESVANQYRTAAKRIDLNRGFVIPFNNLDRGRGFLFLKSSVGNHVYECDCFFAGQLADGVILNRVVKYRDRVSEDEFTFRSNVGEILSLS